MKHMKYLMVLLAFILVLAACGGNTNEDSKKPQEEKDKQTDNENLSEEATKLSGTMSYHIGVYDWGPALDWIVLTLDSEIDSVDKGDLKVVEKKQYTDYAAEGMPQLVGEFERVIEDAYLLTDDKASPSDGPTQYIFISLQVSPSEGNPLLYTPSTGYNTYADPFEVLVSLADGASLKSGDKEVSELEIAKEPTSVYHDADHFVLDTYKASDGVEYEYAQYSPENEAKTLFVWLHGMGEGGVEKTDAYIPLLANKASAYGHQNFQSLVNSYVISPQCPTFWMDPSGQGKEEGSALDVNDGSSFYTESLHEFIMDKKEELGCEDVVLAGCSNGGFMVLRMIIDYPDAYAAGVPICEALLDEHISDEQIERIKDVPLYFVYSKDDPVVDPSLYEIPTIKRLKEAGASNLEVATSDHVIDLSGEYKDEDGNPYQYSGHWSWIYFHNNEAVSENGIKGWQWIADVLSKN